MSDRPNILVVMSDDHAQWAAGCYGDEQVATPHMDALANQGVRYANAMTVTPVCSPARASFWTGLMPSQHGIHDWLNRDDHPGLSGFETLGSLLKGRGYQTAMIGKWHCGNDYQPAAGFDRWFSHLTQHCPHHGDLHLCDQGEMVTRQGYVEEHLTAEARAFLEQRDASRPFLLYVGYTATHSPFRDHPARWVERYRAAALDAVPCEALDGRHRPARPALAAEASTQHEKLAQYYAAVSHIDEQLGELLAALDRSGAAEQTLVVYTADHGHMCGQHGLWCKGNATVPQNFFEESIRIPMIARWPGRLATGEVSQPFAGPCDLHETLRIAGGVEAKAGPPRPGRDLLEPAMPDAVHVGEYGDARVIRDARYKLIRWYDRDGACIGELMFDLVDDPRERCDVARAEGVAVDRGRLGERLEAFFERYTDAEHTGVRVMDRPAVNPNEPWRAALEQVSR